MGVLLRCSTSQLSGTSAADSDGLQPTETAPHTTAAGREGHLRSLPRWSRQRRYGRESHDIELPDVTVS
ncbi:hypothetical protein I553_3883 [Mycobacterium xenopi 4042]|uniref:Uncharacterized protein n=1 Tax=Mycobacterium xenopi 4042 TaxID=1299334 RepID=X8DCR3_MYCXE|nr:hypothetical protein I553_3883 [Mycobacterium xenopi 4042]